MHSIVFVCFFSQRNREGSGREGVEGGREGGRARTVGKEGGRKEERVGVRDREIKCIIFQTDRKDRMGKGYSLRVSGGWVGNGGGLER
jgi:hypothetical protein